MAPASARGVRRPTAWLASRSPHKHVGQALASPTLPSPLGLPPPAASTSPTPTPCPRASCTIRTTWRGPTSSCSPPTHVSRVLGVLWRGPLRRQPRATPAVRLPRRHHLTPPCPLLPPLPLCSPAAAYSQRSEQYAWLARDLAGVDRSQTPWVLAIMHAPWYNSNYAHQVGAPFTPGALPHIICSQIFRSGYEGAMSTWSGVHTTNLTRTRLALPPCPAPPHCAGRGRGDAQGDGGPAVRARRRLCVQRCVHFSLQLCSQALERAASRRCGTRRCCGRRGLHSLATASRCVSCYRCPRAQATCTRTSATIACSTASSTTARPSTCEEGGASPLLALRRLPRCGRLAAP